MNIERDDASQPSTRSNRRRFFRWLGGAAGLALLGGIDGFVIEPNLLEVNHHRIDVPGLPDALDGYTIAHVTDTHFGRARGAHKKALAWIEQNEPDLVACTGDLVESVRSLERFEPYGRRLVECASEIVTVPGNWEWREGRPGIRTITRRFDEFGLPTLANDWMVLEDGLVVGGGDDPVTGRFDADSLFADVPDGAVYLFLAHAPIVFDRSFPQAPNFTLSLAGHTHGGQIRLGPYAPITPPLERSIHEWFLRYGIRSHLRQPRNRHDHGAVPTDVPPGAPRLHAPSDVNRSTHLQRFWTNRGKTFTSPDSLSTETSWKIV